MRNDVIKKAKKVVKDLNYEINLNTVLYYLRREGYATFFYDTENTHPVLKSMGEYYVEYSRGNVNAFICDGCEGDKYAFIRNELPLGEKLTSALHELGHVMLEHLNMTFRDFEMEEFEADAFVYYAMYYSNLYYSKPHFIKTILHKMQCFSDKMKRRKSYSEWGVM